MEKEIRKSLFLAIAAYRKATGNSIGTVSKKFYGNQNFLRDFKQGKASITLRALDLFLDRMVKAWPEGAEWPAMMPVSLPKPKGRKIS